LIDYLGRKLGNYFHHNKYPNKLELNTWIDGFKILLLYIFSIVILTMFIIVSHNWLGVLLNIIFLSVMRLIKNGRHFSIDKCLLVTNGLLLISTIFSTYLVNKYFLISVLIVVLSIILLLRKIIYIKDYKTFIMYIAIIMISLLSLHMVFITVIFITLDYSTIK